MRSRDAAGTRKKLVGSAFWEIYRNGYHRARLDAILDGTGVTKGALYHHFADKRSLGYAVVDEVIRPWILRRWLQDVDGAPDPLDAIAASARRVVSEATEESIRCGCPLNNLVQEMAQLDEGFRSRLASVMDDWRAGLARALVAGQERGRVRIDVDAGAAALILVGTLEGLASLSKCSGDRDVVRRAMEGLEALLDGLRPTRGPPRPASG
jgi:AcrR family transcriptional regulator